MKYTDEQLSRILSAHCGGSLKRGGMYWSAERLIKPSFYSRMVCINQAAFNGTCTSDDGPRCYPIIDWFDENYQPTWTPDRFLQELEKRGWA